MHAIHLHTVQRKKVCVRECGENERMNDKVSKWSKPVTISEPG